MNRRKNVSQSAALCNNTNKYGITIGLTYGNYKVLEQVKVPYKYKKYKSDEYKIGLKTAWKCFHIPTEKIKIINTGYLAEFKTEKQELENINKLIIENKHQLGFRNYLYRVYRTGALKRNISFNLTQEEFENIIFQNCYYCGQEPQFASVELISKRGNTKQPSLAYNGIDRVNSDLGYTVDNCVSCCSMCNYMKKTYSKEDFLNHVFKIYLFLIQSSETIENTLFNNESELSTLQANGSGNEAPLTGNAEGEDIVRTVL